MTENNNVNKIFDILLAVTEQANRQKVQFADARAVAGASSSVMVQDRKAEKMFYSEGGGVAIRVLVDGAWGFASCDGFDLKTISDCLDEAITLAKSSSEVIAEPAAVCPSEIIVDHIELTGKYEIEQISLSDKQKQCLMLEEAALKAGQNKIVNSIVSYSDGYRQQWVVNTFGTRVYSRIVRARVSCQLTALDGQIRQRNYQVLGHQGGPEILMDIEPEQLSVKAANKVLAQLKAKKAPAGEYPVIFHPTISGLLAHEALGHNAEADAIWSGQSILQGRIGDKIASELVTIIDDATIPGKFGSEPFDSEGMRTRERVIVKDGVFVEPLHCLETAAKFGVASNGCGRAQDYHNIPLCRMSNTFFAPGNSTVDEMIKGIDKGIYLREGHEGYVYPERGQFLCHASEAQMIENGQLGEPLRDVSVSGLILETLMNIDMVGNDFEMIFPGTCGKGGQGVPTDCGGPHLRVKKMVVGGIGQI